MMYDYVMYDICMETDVIAYVPTQVSIEVAVYRDYLGRNFGFLFS